jgi:hypothetical protein
MDHWYRAGLHSPPVWVGLEFSLKGKDAARLNNKIPLLSLYSTTVFWLFRHISRTTFPGGSVTVSFIVFGGIVGLAFSFSALVGVVGLAGPGFTVGKCVNDVCIDDTGVTP